MSRLAVAAKRDAIRGIGYELFIADTSVVPPLVFTSCARVHIIRSLAAKHESRFTDHEFRFAANR
ncbi:hypothetical protein C2L64_43295 [Paraburkholderia hospita]|uniref:Uncharacterized protein n=1 Tax=Paraburkholderia hospita TaxID=169430 RepID=A0AAN1MPT8_9BURK|nr:hypothetical protein C2L64_43295 [Paraburkholderia hospita]